MPKSFNNTAASDSAFQPSNSAKRSSNFAAFIPSSSEKSGFEYIASFSFIILYSSSFPIITVSITVYSSKAKWSCFKTESLSVFSFVTSPLLGSSSPDRTFKNVDFPAPFAPIIP